MKISPLNPNPSYLTKPLWSLKPLISLPVSLPSISSLTPKLAIPQISSTTQTAQKTPVKLPTPPFPRNINRARFPPFSQLPVPKVLPLGGRVRPLVIISIVHPHLGTTADQDTGTSRAVQVAFD